MISLLSIDRPTNITTRITYPFGIIYLNGIKSIIILLEIFNIYEDEFFEFRNKLNCYNLYWNAAIQASPIAGEYFSLNIYSYYTLVWAYYKKKLCWHWLGSLVNSSLWLVKHYIDEKKKTRELKIDFLDVFIFRQSLFDCCSLSWKTYYCWIGERQKQIINVK